MVLSLKEHYIRYSQTQIYSAHLQIESKHPTDHGRLGLGFEGSLTYAHKTILEYRLSEFYPTLRTKMILAVPAMICKNRIHKLLGAGVSKCRKKDLCIEEKIVSTTQANQFVSP